MLITIYRWLKLDHDAFRYDHDLAASLGLLEDGPGEVEPPSVKSVTSAALKSNTNWGDYHRLAAAHPLLSGLNVKAQGTPEQPSVRIELNASPGLFGPESPDLSIDSSGYSNLKEKGLLSQYQLMIVRWPLFDTGRRRQGLYCMPDHDPQSINGRLVWMRAREGVDHKLRIESFEGNDGSSAELLYAILEGRIAPCSDWSSPQVKASLLEQATT